MTMLLLAHRIIPDWAAEFLEYLGNNPWVLYLFVASTIGLIIWIKVRKLRQ